MSSYGKQCPDMDSQVQSHPASQILPWPARSRQDQPVPARFSCDQPFVCPATYPAPHTHDMANHIQPARSSYGQSGLARSNHILPGPGWLATSTHPHPCSAIANNDHPLPPWSRHGRPGPSIASMASYGGPSAARPSLVHPYVLPWPIMSTI